jgi:hypothetical protein
MPLHHLVLFLGGTLTALGAVPADEAGQRLAPFFGPPAELAGDLGNYRSPLTFADGRPVQNAADWRKRRQEILTTWHSLMGPWPALIGKPKLERLEQERRDNLTQYHVRLEIAPDRTTDDAYLLVPDGTGPFPAVLVVFYDAGTGIGRGKAGHCDFAYQLARRGFVTLSLGSAPATFYPNKAKAQLQPLSFHAYVAANAHTALGGVPQVDPRRIGVLGHSYGGKWALFAACLHEKFACGAWSDPGVAFDETRANVNYWEPWYLGYEPDRERKPGIPTEQNPRTGAYKKLVEAGHDLHELQALMAPRPFLVSGGAEDPPGRWKALNHAVAVNDLLGHKNRVALTNRPGHAPTPESNELIYLFFEQVLKNGPPGGPREKQPAAPQPAIPPETPQEALRRHQRVRERRRGVDVICHRGASEHAHENTLEAFRATFELGGDGNEFDIRATKDGVLVVFHDDMLDRLLVAYGDVSDYAWEELQHFPFRDPGRFAAQCRIPTLVEVFDLHRRHGGLMHLDIKRPGLDRAIAELLTRMDLWDHVAYCNEENGGVILRDPRLRLRRYKAGLYLDRGEVFPDAIAAALQNPGDGLIVDDPRGVAVALGRKLDKLPREPVSPRGAATPKDDATRPSEAQLLALLRAADDWDRVAERAADREASAQRIRTRAWAADQLLAARESSHEVFAVLAERVRKRSLHKDWMYHGLDGATALRALILLRAPNAVETARLALWRDDPALEPVIDPRWKNPRAWTDFRVKMVVWPALAKCPGPAAEKLCRDYLALDDAGAHQLGPPQFEEAARALLAVSPRTETALELLRHRLQGVRGRAILDCLAHAQEAWARAALEKGAPQALAYRLED